MKSVSRFFSSNKGTEAKTPSPRPQVAKVAAKNDGLNASGLGAADSLHSGPTTEQAPSANPMRSAMKAPAANGQGGVAVTQDATSKPARKSIKEANAGFDSHYGVASKAMTEEPTGHAPTNAGERVVRITDPTAEHVHHIEISIEERNFKSSGPEPQVLHTNAMLLKAQQKNQPMYSSKFVPTMVWPTGHVYVGAFDKKGLPGPMGKLMLPNGEVLSTNWQNGRCHRATDDEGYTVHFDVPAVTKFTKF